MSWPSFCVLLTFLEIFNAKIVIRMISLLYFLKTSLAFFLIHIISIFLHTRFVVYRFLFHLYVEFDLLIAILSAFPILPWLIIVTSMMMTGLFVKM